LGDEFDIAAIAGTAVSLSVALSQSTSGDDGVRDISVMRVRVMRRVPGQANVVGQDEAGQRSCGTGRSNENGE
jgi:hypothetical protein